MFAYACPSCKQRLLAPAERSGQRTICPKCLRPLVIPPPDADDVTVDLGQSLAEPQPPMAELAEVLTATPPPYTTPGPFDGRAKVAPVPRRSLARTESGMVSLNPTGLAAVDIGAELSAALTMRMKPPPDPPADLNLSTGGWLALSGLALVAWVGGVIYDPALLPFVALVGLLMVAFGFLWAASLAGQRNWLRGAVTLLPPVALWRICLPFGEQGYRPLRFVLTGLLALALYLVGGPAHLGVKGAMAALESDPARGEPEAPLPAGERLAVATRRPDGGLSALVDLAGADYRSAIPLDEHPGVVAELTRLASSPSTRPEIRVQALETLTKWSLPGSRGIVLGMLTGGDSPERKVALRLAPNWPDREMAQAVADRLGTRSEERLAREALEQMAPAAGPALAKLAAGDDPALAMTALELLETVGTPACVPALDRLAERAGDSVVRAEAARVAGAVKRRK